MDPHIWLSSDLEVLSEQLSNPQAAPDNLAALEAIRLSVEQQTLSDAANTDVLVTAVGTAAADKATSQDLENLKAVVQTLLTTVKFQEYFSERRDSANVKPTRFVVSATDGSATAAFTAAKLLLPAAVWTSVPSFLRAQTGGNYIAIIPYSTSAPWPTSI